MKKQFLILMAITITFAMYGFVPIQKATAATQVTKTYSDVSLSSNGSVASNGFSDYWDLTQGNLEISWTWDLTGIKDEDPGTDGWSGADHAWSEMGVRDVTTTSNWSPSNKGVWAASDYNEAWPEAKVNTFAPDPSGSPTLDMDDKFVLQRVSGEAEAKYNLPSAPPSPGNNHRFWFDRDGVDQWQDDSPLAVNGGTYNTNGKYAMKLILKSTDANNGEAYLKINSLDQGFETNGNWNNMELTPAGIKFTGDMKHMQIFQGIYGYGSDHTVSYTSISATGYLRYEPVTVKVRTQAGTGVANLPVEYDEGSGYVSGGNTDSNGDWGKDIAPTTSLKVRVKYNGQWLTLTQNIMTNPDFLFTLGEGNFELLMPKGEAGLVNWKLKIRPVGASTWTDYVVYGSKKIDLAPGEYEYEKSWSPVTSMPLQKIIASKYISGAEKISHQLWRIKKGTSVVVKTASGTDISSSCSVEYSIIINGTGYSYNAAYTNQPIMPQKVTFKYKKTTDASYRTPETVDLITSSYPVVLSY